MAPIGPLDHLPDVEEDDYRESSDEDFNPTVAPVDDSSSSSAEEEDAAAKPAQRKRKRKAPTPDGLDSGDEVTIEAARKRKAKKRKGAKGGDQDDLLLSDNEGGEGGLIKTRAQRKVEQKERRPLARTEGATVDVDALWAHMSAVPLKPLHTPSSAKSQEPHAAKDQDVAMDVQGAPPPLDAQADLVMVRKIYTFAGQRTTEEKEIPRSSLDQHLSDGWKAAEPMSQAAGDAVAEPHAVVPSSTHPKIHRPLRRPSRFDSNPTGFVRGLPPEHQLTWPRKASTSQPGQENAPAPEAPKAPRVEKAQKLNVVDKSRLDWTGFVVKEGIAEELDVHGKTKEAYLGRMEFLAGVEARREEERIRVKATATT